MNTSYLLQSAHVWAGLLMIFAGSCGGQTAAASTSEPETGMRSETPWYEQSLVGMEVGPTGAQFGHSDRADTRYCREFDGREIVRRCVSANSEYLVMWVRDGDYAYYDSQLLPKAPGLGARDPLQETMEEARSTTCRS